MVDPAVRSSPNILVAMRAQSRPIAPDRIGPVGSPHPDLRREERRGQPGRADSAPHRAYVHPPTGRPPRSAPGIGVAQCVSRETASALVTKSHRSAAHAPKGGLRSRTASAASSYLTQPGVRTAAVAGASRVDMRDVSPGHLPDPRRSRRAVSERLTIAPRGPSRPSRTEAPSCPAVRCSSWTGATTQNSAIAACQLTNLPPPPA